MFSFFLKFKFLNFCIISFLINVYSLFSILKNLEVYAQEEDLSFDADQENLNTSTSSDRFQTPSAKFFYDQFSNKKQPSQNVRQTLFQNLDPLNESNAQNKSQQQVTNTVINNSLDSTVCIERTLINKNLDKNQDKNNLNRSISDENNQAFLNNDFAMDLSNPQLNSRSDFILQNNQHYEELLKEKNSANEKLKCYVEQLNELNSNLSEAIQTVQDKFETSLNEKNSVIQDLMLQNNVIAKEKKLAIEDVQGIVLDRICYKTI